MQPFNRDHFDGIRKTLHELSEFLISANQEVPSPYQVSSFLNFIQNYYEEIIQLMRRSTEEIQKQNTIISSRFYMLTVVDIFLIVSIASLLGISFKWTQGELPRFYKRRPEHSNQTLYKYAAALWLGGLSALFLYYQLIRAGYEKNEQMTLLNNYQSIGEEFREIVAYMNNLISHHPSKIEDMSIFSTIHKALVDLSKLLHMPSQEAQSQEARLQF